MTGMKITAPYTVDGVPVMGTYGGAGSLAELGEIRDAGMNAVIGGHKLIDPETPEGAFCRDNGIRVMYHLTGHLYGKPNLLGSIDGAQTTIPLERVRTVVNGFRVIELDGELIRYREMTETALLGCERGVDGTTPAAHRKGAILFWPEPLAAELAEVGDSPNIWGWYVLDDSPGDAMSALRGIYRVIKESDPHDRPVCAGYGGQAAIRNFGPGVCDVMLIYFYPCMEGGYVRTFVSQETQWFLSLAREIVPGMPYIGVYQGFWGMDGFPDIPVTPHQLREQIEDFVRDGAMGVIAFVAQSKERGGRADGWNSRRELIGELREISDEIRTTGGLSVPPEPPELATRRIQPVGHWERPREIPGLVHAWHVAGPFSDVDGKLLDATFPPEQGVDLNAEYETTRRPRGWVCCSHDHVFQLTGVFGGEPLDTAEWHDSVSSVVAYVTCEVTSPREYRDAVLRIGSDDDAILWIDDIQVWRHDGERGILRDQDTARATIPAGKSRILAKVYNRVDMWGFSLRITDDWGNALEGVTFSPSPNVTRVEPAARRART